MIEIINLERLSGDGYKMCANNPLAENLSNITHARLVNASNSADYVQGTFVTGSNSTVEFDVTGQKLITPLKLYVSTNGSTYGEVKSWGGTNGKKVQNYLSDGIFINGTSETITLTGLASQINNISVITDAADPTKFSSYEKAVAGSDVQVTISIWLLADPSATGESGDVSYTISLN